jgi:hypothetical protein
MEALETYGNSTKKEEELKHWGPLTEAQRVWNAKAKVVQKMFKAGSLSRSF